LQGQHYSKACSPRFALDLDDAAPRLLRDLRAPGDLMLQITAIAHDQRRALLEYLKQL